jgi:hypothetical protein
VRLGVGPGAATFVLGLSYGAAASIAGWGVAVPLVFSVLAFSASAQFTLLTTLAAGSVVAAVTAAILINVRYLVMSVALNGSLRGGRLWRAVQAQALADASFVVAHRGGGQFDVARLVGASVPQDTFPDTHSRRLTLVPEQDSTGTRDGWSPRPPLIRRHGLRST